jgi:hypothetical protein
MCRHHLRFYQISARSDFKYGRQVTILDGKPAIKEVIDDYYSWTNGWIISTRAVTWNMVHYVPLGQMTW